MGFTIEDCDGCAYYQEGFTCMKEVCTKDSPEWPQLLEMLEGVTSDTFGDSLDSDVVTIIEENLSTYQLAKTRMAECDCDSAEALRWHGVMKVHEYSIECLRHIYGEYF